MATENNSQSIEQCKSVADILLALQSNDLALSLLTVFGGKGKWVKKAIKEELLNNANTNFIDECLNDPELIQNLKKHYDGNMLALRILDNEKLSWISKKLGLNKQQSFLKNYILGDEKIKKNMEVLFTLRSMGEHGEKGFPQTDAPAFDVGNKFCVIRKYQTTGLLSKVFISEKSYTNYINKIEFEHRVTKFGDEGVLSNEFKIQPYGQGNYGNNAGIMRFNKSDKENEVGYYEEVYFEEKCGLINPFGFNDDPNETLLDSTGCKAFAGIIRRLPTNEYKKILSEWFTGYSKPGEEHLPSNQLFLYICVNHSDKYKQAILEKTVEGYNILFVFDDPTESFNYIPSKFGGVGMDENEMYLKKNNTKKGFKILRRCKDGKYRYVYDLECALMKIKLPFYNLTNIELGSNKGEKNINIYGDKDQKQMTIKLDDNEEYKVVELVDLMVPDTYKNRELLGEKIESFNSESFA